MAVVGDGPGGSWGLESTRMLCSAGVVVASQSDGAAYVNAVEEHAAAPASPTWHQDRRSVANRAHTTVEENIAEAATSAAPAQPQGGARAAGSPGRDVGGTASLAAALPPGDSLLRRLLLNTCSSAQGPAS